MLQVCTTDVTCFCDDGYTGTDCSERSNITLLRLIVTAPSPTLPLTTQFDNFTNSTLTTARYIVTTLPGKRHWTGVSWC